MKSSSENQGKSPIRVYRRSESVVFLKTTEAFGGLSNMAGGFPLRVSGIYIRTSEALYQACRFPHMPQVQRLIFDEASPMTAKMKSKPYRDQSRPDWDRVRVAIMRWCLRVKLALHPRQFGNLLLATEDRPIVEESRRDAFWGAKPEKDGTLVGVNALGRLLMELREELKSTGIQPLMGVEPLMIPHFSLLGEPIGIVGIKRKGGEDEKANRPILNDRLPTGATVERQAQLFADFRRTPSDLANPLNARLSITMLPAYAEYQPSSQEWLGEVPKHWHVLPNRAIFVEVKDRNHPDEEMLSVTITRGIVKQKALLEGSSKKDSSNQDKSAYKLVQPSDIAYNKMRAWQGAIGASTLRGIISPAYVVMRLRNADDLPRYFHHLYRTPQFAKEAERWSYGITSDMWSLRPEHFRMIYTPEPPSDEQDAIVRFLDWANGRLERAIRTKRKVIALLNEQKQAIIHCAVTHGLDPSVPLKPSGIPWLGDIPQHWEILRLGNLVDLLTGFPFPSEGFDKSGNGIRLLRGVNVTPSGIRWKDTVYWVRQSEDSLEEFVLKQGDIILGMNRPAIASGIRVSTVQEEDTPALLLQRVARLRPTKRLDARLLLFLLRGRHVWRLHGPDIYRCKCSTPKSGTDSQVQSRTASAR